jgi:hypothetical protein
MNPNSNTQPPGKSPAKPSRPSVTGGAPFDPFAGFAPSVAPTSMATPGGFGTPGAAGFGTGGHGSGTATGSTGSSVAFTSSTMSTSHSTGPANPFAPSGSSAGFAASTGSGAAPLYDPFANLPPAKPPHPQLTKTSTADPFTPSPGSGAFAPSAPTAAPAPAQPRPAPTGNAGFDPFAAFIPSSGSTAAPPASSAPTSAARPVADPFHGFAPSTTAAPAAQPQQQRPQAAADPFAFMPTPAAKPAVPSADPFQPTPAAKPVAPSADPFQPTTSPRPVAAVPPTGTVAPAPASATRSASLYAAGSQVDPFAIAPKPPAPAFNATASAGFDAFAPAKPTTADTQLGFPPTTTEVQAPVAKTAAPPVPARKPQASPSPSTSTSASSNPFDKDDGDNGSGKDNAVAAAIPAKATLQPTKSFRAEPTVENEESEAGTRLAGTQRKSVTTVDPRKISDAGASFRQPTRTSSSMAVNAGIPVIRSPSDFIPIWKRNFYAELFMEYWTVSDEATPKTSTNGSGGVVASVSNMLGGTTITSADCSEKFKRHIGVVAEALRHVLQDKSLLDEKTGSVAQEVFTTLENSMDVFER